MKAPIESQNEISKIVKIKNDTKRDLISILWSKSYQDKNIDSLSLFKIEDLALNQIIKNVEKLALELFPSPFYPLGKYAEALVGIYLNQHSDYQLLAKNIQLIEEKITLGEVDFLLFDKRKKEYIHLEFAIKYYLKVEINDKTHFIGPNAKDSLKRKVVKLKEVQLPLLKKYPHLLPDKFSKIEFKLKLLFKVFCFLPIDEWMKKPQDIFNEGWWASIQDWDKITSQADYFQIITQKSKWIFPYALKNSILEKSYAEEILRTAFENGANHFMLIRLTKDKKVLDRGFIMRNEWQK